MCGPATAIGVASGLSSGMSAIGSFQQGRAQTDATNRARLNQYNDAMKMRQFKYGQDMAVYRAAVNDYKSGIRESDLALADTRTALNKQAQERIDAARIQSQDNNIKQLQAEGKISASMQVGRSRDRALAMTKGAFGRDQAMTESNLLRARFADIDKYRRFADQATSYRRQLYSKLPMEPTMGPAPSAPIMQQGPSALSLIGGLGSAALGGLTAGMGAASDLGRVGGVPGAGTPSALVQGIDVPVSQMPAGMAFP